MKSEIPKVTDDAVSEDTEDEKEEKAFVLFGHEVARKKTYAIGAGLVCAALLIGGGGYAIANDGWNGGRQEEKFENNIKKNPNANAVEKETEKAEESAKNEEPEAKGDSGASEGTGDTASSKKDDGNKAVPARAAIHPSRAAGAKALVVPPRRTIPRRRGVSTTGWRRPRPSTTTR